MTPETKIFFTKRRLIADALTHIRFHDPQMPFWFQTVMLRDENNLYHSLMNFHDTDDPYPYW